MSKDNFKEVEFDLLALKLLEAFLPKSSFLPYTTSSLSFHSIRFIANDIVMHGRNQIIEFGSGISTLILGALLDSLDYKGYIFSVDEDADWAALMGNMLKREGISSVKIIHADLLHDQSHRYHGWYDPEQLIDVDLKANLVLVDGPSAWQVGREKSRIHCLPFLKEHNLLDKNNFALYLDDCNREGEKEILKNWADSLGLKSSVLHHTLGRISAGDRFNLI